MTIVLAFTVLGSVLALGAQHWWAVILFASVALAGAALTQSSPEAKLPPPAIVFFGLGAFSALQALPWPTVALSQLASDTLQVWRDAERTLGSDFGGFALSLDPGASWVEALKWTAYGGAFCLATHVAALRGATAVATIVFGSALVVAGLTLAHGLSGTEQVFGLYDPMTKRASWDVGPLLNPNNRAGYLNLGAFSGLALLVSSRLEKWRWMVGTGVAALMGASLLATSRGATAALLVGVVLALALLAKRLRRSGFAALRGQHSLLLLPLFALTAGFLLFFLGGGGGRWRMLQEEGLEKLELFSWTLLMFEDFTWLGTGRGAFETVFPAYRQTGTQELYQHAENFPLQWGIEWGLPVAGLALGALGWLLRPRRSQGPTVSMLQVGAVVLLLQNFVDLALEVFAVGLALTAILGACYGHRRPPTAAFLKRPSLRGTLLLSSAVLLSGATMAWGRQAAVHQRSRLATAAQRLKSNDLEGRNAVMRIVDDAVRRHPADPYFPLVGAYLRSRHSDPSAMRWIAHALRRDGRSGRAHLVLADVLETRGARAQALLELRLAVSHDPHMAFLAAKRATTWAATIDDALTAIPSGTNGAIMLLELSRAQRFAGSELLLIRAAQERDPDYAPARVAEAHRLLSSLEHPKPSACEGSTRDRCLERLEASVAVLERLGSMPMQTLELRARTLVAQRRTNDADELLSRECQRLGNPPSCLRVRIDVALKTKPGPRRSQAMRHYLTTACVDATTCADAARWLADISARSGDWQGALDYYARAARERPSTRAWLDLARASRNTGQLERARQSLARAAQSAQNDATLLAGIERERQQLLNAPSREPPKP